MVTMVATINRTNFGGRQLVTCWTCHRNRDKPLTTPTMETIYGTPPFEPDDVVGRRLEYLPLSRYWTDTFRRRAGPNAWPA